MHLRLELNMPTPVLAAVVVLVIFMPYVLGGLILQLFPSRIGLLIAILGWITSVGAIISVHVYAASTYPDWWDNGNGWIVILSIAGGIIAIISAIMLIEGAALLTDWE